MKASQFIVPALGSAVAATTAPIQDLNGLCAQACDQYVSQFNFTKTEDHQRANLECHNGCMSISAMPAQFPSVEEVGLEARDAYVNQVYDEMANELQQPGAPLDMKPALDTIYTTLLCASGCPSNSTECGVQCFFAMTGANGGNNTLATRQFDEFDNSGDYASQSAQAVLASRDSNESCLAQCKQKDVAKGKWKCADKCIEQAGFKTQQVKDNVHRCLQVRAQTYAEAQYKKQVAACQRYLTNANGQLNKIAPPHRRDCSSSVEVDWSRSTTTWASSGTIAMLVPTIRSTSTTTVIAEVTATQTEAYAFQTATQYSVYSFRVPVPTPTERIEVESVSMQAVPEETCETDTPSYRVVETPAMTYEALALPTSKEATTMWEPSPSTTVAKPQHSITSCPGMKEDKIMVTTLPAVTSTWTTIHPGANAASSVHGTVSGKALCGLVALVAGIMFL